jgi:hypothetical protein
VTTSARSKGEGLPGRFGVWAAAAALMALPVIMLRLAEESPWDPGDVVFLVILFAGVAIAYEVAARVPAGSAYLAGVLLGVGAALLSAWINLAVGIIGSEDNPANWIYFAVIAVAGLCALLSRFRAAGMALAMAVAALAQGVAFVVALIAGLGFTGPITVFFMALWLASAFLFRKAARYKAAGEVS